MCSDNRCPDSEQLLAFSLGQLSQDTLETIGGHLENCTVCESALGAWDSATDSFLTKFRNTSDRDPYSNEAELHAALGAIAEIGHHPQSSSSTDPSALAALGQYRVGKCLGVGGMGAVYEALQTRLNRLVAIKVLPADRLQDPQSLARFEREMAAVGRLDHHLIVRAHDAGEIEGRHFLVMEHVAGLTLAKLTKEIGPLQVADACELSRQVAEGLQYAHEQGLVHRDVKPSNVMLTREGKVKILDLGLALLHDGQQSNELTYSGQLMGTLDYMAPEQGGDSHEVDKRVDIYSLGATLYYLISGRAPFAGEKHRTTVQKLMALASEQPTPVAELRDDVPSELSAIIDRMLAKQPEDRIATANDVAEALAPFAAQSDLKALAERAVPVPLQFDESSFSQPLPLDPNLATTVELPPQQSASAYRNWSLATWIALGLIGALPAVIFISIALLPGFQTVQPTATTILSENFEYDGDHTWGGGADLFGTNPSAINDSNSPHAAVPDGGQRYGHLVNTSVLHDATRTSKDAGPLVSRPIDLPPGNNIIEFDGWLAAWKEEGDYARIEAEFFSEAGGSGESVGSVVLADGSQTTTDDGVAEYVDAAGNLQADDSGADAHNWKHYVTQNAIPADAKSVKIIYVGDSTMETNGNDAYADNIVITTRFVRE